MKSAPVAAVLLAAALAGCLGATDPPSAGPGTSGASDGAGDGNARVGASAALLVRPGGLPVDVTVDARPGGTDRKEVGLTLGAGAGGADARKVHLTIEAEPLDDAPALVRARVVAEGQEVPLADALIEVTGPMVHDLTVDTTAGKDLVILTEAVMGGARLTLAAAAEGPAVPPLSHGPGGAGSGSGGTGAGAGAGGGAGVGAGNGTGSGVDVGAGAGGEVGVGTGAGSGNGTGAVGGIEPVAPPGATGAGGPPPPSSIAEGDDGRYDARPGAGGNASGGAAGTSTTGVVPRAFATPGAYLTLGGAEADALRLSLDASGTQAPVDALLGLAASGVQGPVVLDLEPRSVDGSGSGAVYVSVFDRADGSILAGARVDVAADGGAPQEVRFDAKGTSEVVVLVEAMEGRMDLVVTAGTEPA